METSSLPGLKAEFVEMLRSHPDLAFLEHSLLTPPDVSIRINPAKTDFHASEDAVAWCAQGQYLAHRPKFTFDPRLHQGLYYVQDASSMAIDAAVRQLTASGEPVRYLDACAAPGGKTTTALSVLPEGSIVVANEFDYRRAEILYENLSKWGAPGVIVSRGDTSKFTKFDGVFDIVAVDAPCSGEGMMRKDAVARNQWSKALVEDCAALQKEILDNVWPALRPGGFLIYSTCTFNRREDEENLEYLVEKYDAIPVVINSLDLVDGIARGIDTSLPAYRFLPGRIRGEGLFFAVVQKPGDKQANAMRVSKKSKGDYVLHAPLDWLEGDYLYYQHDSSIYAFEASKAQEMLGLAQRLHAIYAGVRVAEIKGKDLMPTQELALSQKLRRGAFPEVEVSEDSALNYLRREPVSLPPATPKGFIILTYGNVPLGFVKNLGNRANNLYPKAWRILT